MSQESLTALLGLDIGWINTRASLIGISEGKYHLLGSETAPTSLGPRLHLGAGAGDAMSVLQRSSEHIILKAEGGGLVMPATAVGLGVDQGALTVSAGPRVRTVLLGLSERGSLAAGRALVGSLPLDLVASYGLADLADETRLVESLIKLRPEIVILTGGEDAGAEEPLRRWIGVLGLVCRLLPQQVKPAIIFAGNPHLEDDVRRRLERLTSLHFAANIQPACGEWDLVPAQNLLEREILQAWESKVPGMSDLMRFTHTLRGSKAFSLNRMTRYLNKTMDERQAEVQHHGVMIVDMGGGTTVLSAGLDGRTGTVIEDAWSDISSLQDSERLQAVHQWAAAPVTLQETRQYLTTHALHPGVVPVTLRELALSQSVARYQMKRALRTFSDRHPWFSRSSQEYYGGHFEPVIASGAVLTAAPTPGQTMLILLDGLQPCGITTMVLDRYHLLPLLGVAGEAQPVLPVHMLSAACFENLGTVIAPVSRASKGEVILTVNVKTDAGKAYSVEITQGALRRLVIPAGISAVLELEPCRRTDIGFGGLGIGGHLKVTGGLLGVVIDARGRPLLLPDGDEDRVEQLRRWLWCLGG